MATEREVRALYDRYRSWIRKYKGGVPGGFAAAIMHHESGGRMDAQGDASLGEVGLYQITSTTPGKFGLPASSRYDPETNVFLAMLEYNVGAAEMAPYATPGTSDSYRLSRLGFAIGSAGTRKVIDAATGGKPSLYRGQVFDRVRAWANATGAMAVSSGQDADKVKKRINAVQEQWDIGQRIDGFYGAPEKIPAPGGLRYTIPASAARYLVSPVAGKLLALGAVGLIVFLATRKDDHAPDHAPPA
jgi:Transglycosylase SLT domain